VNLPDFSRAQYADSTAVADGMDEGLSARQIAAGEAFPMAVFFGVLAAILCTFAYAAVWSFGIMFGIVVIGFGWLIAKAMLFASKGYGGRLYQIVASVLVYFTVTCGKLVLPLWQGMHSGSPIPAGYLLEYVFLGPILRLQTGISGVLGIVILGYAIRMTWQMGKGTRTS